MKFLVLVCLFASVAQAYLPPTTAAPTPIPPSPLMYPQLCGDRICQSWFGESCSLCPSDCGMCPSCINICGNHLCEPTENGCICPQDCGVCCVDGLCEAGETAVNCPQDCTTDLVGYVVDRYSVAPIEGASVMCQSEPTLLGQTVVGPVLTDANGTFSFAGLPEDYYTCTATFPNYYPRGESFLFQAGLALTPPPELRIALTPETGSISGEFRDSQTGGYIRFVNVTCTTPHLSTRTQVLWRKPYFKTSSDTFFLDLLPTGPYSCLAEKVGYMPVVHNATVTVGSNTLVQFVLTPYPVLLEGTILLQIPYPLTYEPLNGSVTCTSDLGAVLQTNVTVGSYSVFLLPWTTYSCVASSSDPPALSRQFTINGADPNTTIIFNYWLALALENIDNFGNSDGFIRQAIHLSLRLGDRVPAVTPLNLTLFFGVQAGDIYTQSITASIISVLPVNINVNGMTDLIFKYFYNIGQDLSFSRLKFYTPVVEQLDETSGTAMVSGYLKGIQRSPDIHLGDTTTPGTWSTFLGQASFYLRRLPVVAGDEPTFQISNFTYYEQARFSTVF